MAGDTLIGGGQAVRQSHKRSLRRLRAGALSEAVPAEIHRGGVDAANAAAKAEGFDNWVRGSTSRRTGRSTRSCRCSGPYRTVQPINNPTWVMERNPFYWAVDTAGNQLPYIDRVVMTLAENLEVLNLRAMAGEYDLQERHIDLGKLPVILENQDARQVQGPSRPRAQRLRRDLPLQPELRRRPGDREVAAQRRLPPRALASRIDRNQLNETFWLGVATPGSPAPGEALPYFPGQGWREKWSTFDPQDGQRAARRDRPYRRRTARASACAPTTASACASRCRRCRPSCPGRRSARWSPTSGARSASRPTCATPSATSPLPARRTTSTTSWCGPTAAPSCSTSSRATPSRSIRPKPSWGRNSPSGTPRTARRARSRSDPNLLKIFDLFRAAAGQKTDDRIKTAQEIWKILIDQQYAIGTVGQSPALMGVRLASDKLGNIPCAQLHRPALPHARRLASGEWYYKN